VEALVYAEEGQVLRKYSVISCVAIMDLMKEQQEASEQEHFEVSGDQQA
jgi:hypothetical protein